MSDNDQSAGAEAAAESEPAVPPPAAEPQDPPREVGSGWLYSVEERSSSEPYDKRG
jgi:hypothetical protein